MNVEIGFVFILLQAFYEDIVSMSSKTTKGLQGELY